MSNITKIIDGYRNFYNLFFKEDVEKYKNLASVGQFPKTMVIACSDSRVDPSIVTNAEPGELFVIRNVANLVPPYQEDSSTYHGTSAALEFAVRNLGIENIIIIGHSKCAGIQALVMDDNKPTEDFSFIREWVNIAKKAKDKVLLDAANSPHNDMICTECEKESILLSLENLKTYPWILEKIQSKTLNIYGWYFDLLSGIISQYDHDARKFISII